jgi:hypothetical protein
MGFASIVSRPSILALFQSVPGRDIGDGYPRTACFLI